MAFDTNLLSVTYLINYILHTFLHFDALINKTNNINYQQLFKLSLERNFLTREDFMSDLITLI